MASTDRSRRDTERSPAEFRRGSPYWLIVQRGVSSLEGFYTIEVSGEELALPVFSSEEEAELFLRYCGEGWEIREIPAKDLITLLVREGHYIGRVALDPVAEIDPTPMIVGWEVFLDSLLGRGRHWFESRDGHQGKAH